MVTTRLIATVLFDSREDHIVCVQLRTSAQMTAYHARFTHMQSLLSRDYIFKDRLANLSRESPLI